MCHHAFLTGIMSGLKKRGYVRGSPILPNMPDHSTRLVVNIYCKTCKPDHHFIYCHMQKKKGKVLTKSEDSSKAKRKAPKENKGGGGGGGGGGVIPKIEAEEQRVPPTSLEVKGESVVSGTTPRTPLRPSRPPSAKRRSPPSDQQATPQGGPSLSCVLESDLVCPLTH